MNRRTLLKVVALSTLGGSLDAAGGVFPGNPGQRAAWTAANYQPAFFTEAEIELLDQTMEIIIPADEHSGGAHAAKVAFFADRLVSTGSDAWRKEWRDGLQLLSGEAAKSSLAKALASAARGETNPQTDLERFFVTVKQMTVNGYYSSEIGIHQDLQYQGNTYVAEFPGCTDAQQY